MISRPLVLLLLALTVMPLPAAAQSKTKKPLGMMQASTFEQIPSTFPIRVRPMANTALDRDLVGVFETALQDAGYQLAERGAYVFSFRVSGEVGRQRAQSRLQLEGQGGSSSADEDVAVTLRFKTGQKPASQRGERDQLLLARLQDPAGHIVWEARVTFLEGRSPDYDTVSAVAPSLVGQLGREALGRQLP